MLVLADFNKLRWARSVMKEDDNKEFAASTEDP